MALAYHRIPYKALGRCGIEELAAEQRARDRRDGRLTSGVAFARKISETEKHGARREILRLLTSELMPRPISVLTMPGISWTFEHDLLAQRETNWTKTKDLKRTRLFCVENDRFVFYSATTKMPGSRHGMTLRTLERPTYAETALGNRAVESFAFANVDDVIAGAQCFDVAWLDYTGPLTVERRDLIARFFRERVRSILVVTVLKARWNQATDRASHRHGGYCEWAVAPFHDAIGLHAMEYQDGASPMFQFACRKATGSAA